MESSACAAGSVEPFDGRGLQPGGRPLESAHRRVRNLARRMLQQAVRV